MYWLKLFTGNFCPVCGKMIDIDLPLCKECKNAPAYSPNKQIIGGEFECVSAFEHYGTFRNIMLDYKYHGHKEYYDNFAMILCELIDKYYADIKFDYFTAVPSYGKEKTHGFEKVISIAKEASRIQRVKYKQLLVQYQLCKKQHLLTSEKRKENVKNIFTAMFPLRSISNTRTGCLSPGPGAVSTGTRNFSGWKQGQKPGDGEIWRNTEGSPSSPAGAASTTGNPARPSRSGSTRSCGRQTGSMAAAFPAQASGAAASL